MRLGCPARRAADEPTRVRPLRLPENREVAKVPGGNGLCCCRSPRQSDAELPPAAHRPYAAHGGQLSAIPSQNPAFSAPKWAQCRRYRPRVRDARMSQAATQSQVRGCRLWASCSPFFCTPLSFSVALIFYSARHCLCRYLVKIHSKAQPPSPTYHFRHRPTSPRPLTSPGDLEKTDAE